MKSQTCVVRTTLDSYVCFTPKQLVARYKAKLSERMKISNNRHSSASQSQYSSFTYMTSCLYTCSLVLLM